MLHSTYYHKNTNEDPKTSAIFENLMLLPDNVFWYILRCSCSDNSSLPTNTGRLISYRFWPHWDKTNTNNANYIEPDLFLEFEEFDIIIEAKYGDRSGQYRDQWEKEIIAYSNEYELKKEFVFIAVGGNISTKTEIIKVKNHSITIYKCSWLSLLININRYDKELECVTVFDMNLSATRRLLSNIILAFNINGVYNIDWFNTIAQSHTIISQSSIENLSTFFKF